VWPLAVITLAIAGWLFAMAALIAFRARSYELHLDRRGFRVHDLFGSVTHDVRWGEVVDLIPVNVNAFSFIVVAWVCAPRRPKHGRLRWRRGTAHDDGCMPDTYGMRADRLIALMHEHAADPPRRSALGARPRWSVQARPGRVGRALEQLEHRLDAQIAMGSAPSNGSPAKFVPPRTHGWRPFPGCRGWQRQARCTTVPGPPMPLPWQTVRCSLPRSG